MDPGTQAAIRKPKVTWRSQRKEQLSSVPALACPSHLFKNVLLHSSALPVTPCDRCLGCFCDEARGPVCQVTLQDDCRVRGAVRSQCEITDMSILRAQPTHNPDQTHSSAHAHGPQSQIILQRFQSGPLTSSQSDTATTGTGRAPQ